MEKDPEKIFHELKEDVSTFVELKLELLKLSAYERGGKIISTLSYDLLLLFLAFFAILFLFVALGFYLGDLLRSYGAGFAVVVILYLLMIGIGMKYKERIKLKIMNVIISVFMAKDDKDDKKDDKDDTTDKQQPAHAAGEADF